MNIEKHICDLKEDVDGLTNDLSSSKNQVMCTVLLSGN